jgi:hypothetical protein
MSSLDEALANWRNDCEARDRWAPAQRSLYYFVYPPENALEVKRLLPVWSARLRNNGVEVQRISFSDLLWKLIDASGRWDDWLQVENDYDREQVNEAIRDVLRSGDALIKEVAAVVGEEKPDSVAFLTETEMLHPTSGFGRWKRAARQRENTDGRLYPGRRAGQFGLRFLDFYPRTETTGPRLLEDSRDCYRNRFIRSLFSTRRPIDRPIEKSLITTRWTRFDYVQKSRNTKLLKGV